MLIRKKGYENLTQICVYAVLQEPAEIICHACFFNESFRTCGKISEFDKIPGY